jgi:antitoxin HicB
MDQSIDYYMRLPYAVKVVPSEDGYFARVEDLPGCEAWASNIEDLWPAVNQAKRAWIEDALHREIRIPEPGESEENLKYSGRILVRMPKSLHRDLTTKAHQEGVSLNHFIVTALARSIGLPGKPLDGLFFPYESP